MLHHLIPSTYAIFIMSLYFPFVLLALLCSSHSPILLYFQKRFKENEVNDALTLSIYEAAKQSQLLYCLYRFLFVLCLSSCNNLTSCSLVQIRLINDMLNFEMHYIHIITLYKNKFTISDLQSYGIIHFLQ